MYIWELLMTKLMAEIKQIEERKWDFGVVIWKSVDYVHGACEAKKKRKNE